MNILLKKSIVFISFISINTVTIIPVKADVKEPKSASELIEKKMNQEKSDQCLYLLSLYRGLLSTAGKLTTPMNAIVDTTARHQTLNRVLMMSWMIQCPLQPFINAEAEKLSSK